MKNDLNDVIMQLVFLRAKIGHGAVPVVIETHGDVAIREIAAEKSGTGQDYVVIMGHDD